MARRPQDEIAWDLILPQHQRPTRITEGFVRAHYDPLTLTAKALDDLRNSLNMDDATGARLDLIGSIVGITREVPEGVVMEYFGYESQPNVTGYDQARYFTNGDPLLTSYQAPDAEFRQMIRAKIALNNSHGTAPEIIAALSTIYGVPVSVETIGPGKAEAWIGRIVSPSEALARNPSRFIPGAAGVKFFPVFYNQGATFGYEGQPGATGYGDGPYARTPDSNGKEIT